MSDRPTGPESPTTAPLDRSVLLRVRKRIPEALELFFEHFFHRVYGYAVILLGDSTLAEDLTQEAFLRMHRAIDRLDPDRDPAPWVFTVITNVVRDYWRSAGGRMERAQTALEEERELVDSSVGADPEEQRDREERGAYVRQALSAVSSQDREVILLRDYEELPVGEVAVMLNLTEDAARQRHSRAIRRLGEAYRRLVGMKSGPARRPDQESPSDRQGR